MNTDRQRGAFFFGMLIDLEKSKQPGDTGLGAIRGAVTRISEICKRPRVNGAKEGSDMRKAAFLSAIPMVAILIPLFFIVGTVISIAVQEGMAVQTTILVIITLLGLMIPLTWFIGTMTAMIYFYLNRADATRESLDAPLHSQLGLTMADGGDSIEKKEKG